MRSIYGDRQTVVWAIQCRLAQPVSSLLGRPTGHQVAYWRRGRCRYSQRVWSRANWGAVNDTADSCHPRDMMQWTKCVILRRPDASHASETTKVFFCALINPHTCTMRTRFFSNKAIVYVNLQYRMTTANRRNITNVYRIKRIKPTKTSYAGQTDNGQRTDRNLNQETGRTA